MADLKVRPLDDSVAEALKAGAARFSAERPRSLALTHMAPDSVYLALAEREGALLASADRKLLALARQRGVEGIEVPSA